MQTQTCMYLLRVSDASVVHMHGLPADFVGQSHVSIPGGTKRNHPLALDQHGLRFITNMVTTAHFDEWRDISIVPATHTRFNNKHTRNISTANYTYGILRMLPPDASLYARK